MLFHGGGFGGGGFHGGGFGGGGFRAAGFSGGGFRGTAIGGGAFRASPVGGSTFRAAAIGRGTGFRTAAIAAGAPAVAGRAAFVSSGFRGGFHHHGFHRRFLPVFVGAGFGSYAYYGDYYPYDYGYYDDPYVGYDNGYSDTGCYIVRQRVHTPYGWRACGEYRSAAEP